MYMIIGIDEVGRGCWAGPLVAAAVLLRIPIDGLTDSKKLSKKRREMLDEQIKEHAEVGIGWVSPADVDRLGLTAATAQAMRNALEQIHVSDAEVIIDGSINYLPDVQNTKNLIKADSLVPEVSAASIVAKVARDNYMAKIADKFPMYQFEKHVGYGTAQHLEMLKLYGVSELHRLSYKPIQALLT